MNIAWSRKILETLASEGVREIVFCAGARNSPIVTVLAKTEGLLLHSFFEERSAAFFALGVARRKGKPVAIVTTSGTAAAELLPATIEAFHTGVPLILVTADRPRRLRGTGAPQAIDQTGLFAKFVGHEFDIESGELFSLEKWNRRSPVHLNVCFDEPLIDETIESLSFVSETESESFVGQSKFATTAGVDWASLRLTKFLRGRGPLLVLVGTLESDSERESVAHFLKRLGAPAYIEGTSGLRERADLSVLSLRSGDRLLSWALKHNLVSRVLRIGGVPTVRIWRDLEEPTSPIETMSLSALPFAGLSRGELLCAQIAATLDAVSVERSSSEHSRELFKKDEESSAKLRGLFESEPQAEPSLVHSLSALIPSSALVYVGNSLPIREWDLAASYDHVFALEANRGVNGIDGQISTFLGLARETTENWSIIGDLTALYDMPGPWALSCRGDVRVRFVVINNGGGKIFSRIFKHSLFENNHDLDFEHWAKMWRLGYEKWTSIPQRYEGGKADVIEIVPDPESTKRFWDTYDQMWS